MPTAKAKYVGDGAWEPPCDFSNSLKSIIRKFSPQLHDEADPTFGHPADEFVVIVLIAARWGLDAMRRRKYRVNKREIRAEQKDILKRLRATERRLRTLSPDFDRLLGIDADPRGCADGIKKLAKLVEAASSKIDHMPSALRAAEAQRRIAVEMSILVLRELKAYKLSIGATAAPDTGSASAGVQILQAIGNDIGLRLSITTWRDIVRDAKRAAKI